MPYFIIDEEADNAVNKMWKEVAKRLHLKWAEKHTSFIIPDERKVNVVDDGVMAYFRYAKQTNPDTGEVTNVAVTAAAVTGKWLVEVLRTGGKIDVIMQSR